MVQVMKFKTSASINTAPGMYFYSFTVESTEYSNHVDEIKVAIKVLKEKPNNIPPYFTGTFIYT
jgi:hypothetical protein